jgi:hypothetical protein
MAATCSPLLTHKWVCFFLKIINDRSEFFLKKIGVPTRCLVDVERAALAAVHTGIAPAAEAASNVLHLVFAKVVPDACGIDPIRPPYLAEVHLTHRSQGEYPSHTHSLLQCMTVQEAFLLEIACACALG